MMSSFCSAKRLAFVAFARTLPTELVAAVGDLLPAHFLEVLVKFAETTALDVEMEAVRRKLEAGGLSGETPDGPTLV